MENYNFTPLEIDAIGEILNISLGSSATAISNMLSKRVDITTPNVAVSTFEEFEFAALEPATGIEITYTDGLNGNNVMIFKRQDIKAIVELLMSCEIPDEEFELNEMNLSAICEVMNQMMGASATALSEFLDATVNISTPVPFQITSADEFKSKYFVSEGAMVTVRFKLMIENTLESEFLCLLPNELAKRLLKSFSLSDEESADEVPTVVPEVNAINESPAVQQAPAQSVAVPEPAPRVEHETEAFAMPPYYVKPSEEPRVISVQSPLAAAPESIDLGRITQQHPDNLGLIMSVPLQISVEIGRTKRPLREILEFSQGTVVMLDKLAGDSVDLFVNGQCVAKGDVVVVDDSFALRISEVVKPVEINK